MHIQLTWKSIRVVYGNVNERIEQFFNWGLQSDYHFVIGLKISCHFFHQWENKNQSRSARTGFLALWTSHVLFFHILIGLLRSKTDAICQNYFGFTTLNLQTLWLLFSRFILCKLQQYRERFSGIPQGLATITNVNFTTFGVCTRHGVWHVVVPNYFVT